MAKWALVSVFDKRGVVAFCRQLVAAGYGILSTGGTAKHLRDNGIDCTLVEDYTGFPEMMDGRVKTLHPKVHGGLLARRDDPEHRAAMAAHGIHEIDVVVVNLYPFEQTIARPETTFAEAVEMVDIGGPSMLRSAAKNHAFVLPVVDPDDYGWIGARLAAGEAITEPERRRLAAKVFAATSKYDAAIAGYLAAQADGAASEAVAGPSRDGSADGEASETGVAWPEVYRIEYVHKMSLRYGENPHQGAHFYVERDPLPSTIAAAEQLQGKELSYNNIQDADAALQILRDLDDLGPAAVAVKHTNPCGVGLGGTVEEAFARAYESDPVSIFGGILAFNRPVTGPLAQKLTEMFLEIVIAPSFTEEALAAFKRKKNVRLLTVDFRAPLWRPGDKWFRRVSGGLLVQDVNLPPEAEWRVVTRREPTAEERRALEFAWRVVRHVKSNAIVIANAHGTLGVGAGQMNRVGAARIAIEQAGARVAGSVLASDAFFPMRDTVDTAAAAGVRAIIQPGGSIRDQESIDAADEHGIAMVFTGQRHFLH
ncbi:MAG: bifunctional phosphoribosylaminoimidazolecarboxamide formyltransferase/IMP cyclohydrolase [Alicyclobacillus macrosporangiidus]|uniref:bifunctional phosphoribosylaminoimidazolecarboxamide formyltransferase/IMP cyclohydrolase n=1 Tax=Alicyclobacillus macrosporangiidus TaxID=392015 RepID=UPI0026F05FAC|nr:bifunctional phosphoribosylaminoimidazolecarboxamide formyltransferase/IMP cyclohydrolase [Alicyclobacillus macrosporangiidus]MCL6599462.1 bifunctional phosphoribosylaminoimidazolecarboxamide formyltransferase/IMP cyclohydrolase [Alicyclobacillus macrosporangiidus]